ncbi:hypothetical protein [Kutzneria buriramensis]|uniref:DDE family transposase n=1 Tax=Kutzneria buriramensis TaxID=1045776 RepID=A0A3E0GUK8_9PSEU|nr:hypothetical protein [Kutzneria buriramensis]REH28580.1 hypothetical protein BCF44_12622 [Kutzneria buriramensis]
MAVVTSAANRNDHLELATVVDAVAPVKEPTGRPRKVRADKGDDYPPCRKAMSRRGIIARIARRVSSRPSAWVAIGT